MDRYLGFQGEGELVCAVEKLEQRVDDREMMHLGKRLVTGPVGEGHVPSSLLRSVSLSMAWRGRWLWSKLLCADANQH